MTLRRYKRIYCIVRNKTQSSKRHQWYQFSGIFQEAVYAHTRNYFCMTFPSSFYLTKPPCILPFQLKMCLRHWPCQYIKSFLTSFSQLHNIPLYECTTTYLTRLLPIFISHFSHLTSDSVSILHVYEDISYVTC